MSARTDSVDLIIYFAMIVQTVKKTVQEFHEEKWYIIEILVHDLLLYKALGNPTDRLRGKKTIPEDHKIFF